MKVIEAIKNRRSIRNYKEEQIDQNKIDLILEAGRWAPSGLNNQPWKFLVVSDENKKNSIAAFTKYSRIIEQAVCCICVFLDKETSYHREKDIMAVGACVQNMLLAAHEQNIGTCWLGEILNCREQVEKCFNTPENLELMAVISLGLPEEKDAGKSDRKKISEIMIQE